MHEDLHWIKLDESRWPLVSCTMYGSPSDEEFRALLDRIARCLKRGEPHAYVVDLQSAELPKRERRERLLQTLSSHEVAIANFVVGIALVLPETTFRFARSALLLKKWKLAPGSVHGSLEAGVTWCRQQLAKAAVKRPRAPRRPDR